MSIFSEDSPMDPSSWLKEKTLRALKDAARFVDLANEPDTTDWYAKELRARAEPLIAHLVPIVTLIHHADEEAASSDAWRAIVKGGSFALAGWCKKHEVVDPAERLFGALAEERAKDEVEAKRIVLPQDVLRVDAQGAMDLRAEVSVALAERMARSDFNANELRLLAWLLRNLRMSELADVVSVLKRFLPTDAGLSVEATNEAYASLYERGVLERVDHLPGFSEERLALRLVGGDRNKSRHPSPFKPETFGYPGARIGGQPTLGNEVLLELPETVAEIVRRWELGEEDLAGLRDHLQHELGHERVFVERARVLKGALRVKYRLPMDADEAVLVADLRKAAEAWVRRRTVT